ncbi:MAG: hypothetical protein JHD16_10220 [Solirubrobacteraceae bacterium]|nr:hypothetical protein [Solirubrobacteraceae bacterium]
MSPFLPRAGRGLLLAAAALAPLAFASTAAAVDAPTRIVDLNEAGQRADGWTAAIAPGGREVLLGQRANPLDNSSPITLKIRDLVTAKTTPVLPAGHEIADYSDDLKRFLVSTKVSYDAADTNGAADLYVYDRPTGRGTLVTRGADGKALGAGDRLGVLSGDGKVAFYSAPLPAGGTMTYRVVVSAGAPQPIIGSAIAGDADFTGSVITTAEGHVVGTKRTPNQGREVDALNYGKLAGNGSVVVDITGWQYTSAVRVVDLNTGTARSIALPSWVQREYPAMVGVSPDGSKAVLVISMSRGSAAGLRLVLGTVDLKTGAIAQLGNDLPWPGGRASIISPDWAFASSGPYLAQLGSTPIPGSDVAIPVVPPRPATDYLQFYEGCKGYPNLFPPVPSGRPSLALGAAALGISPQVPARADVVVKNTSTGRITNQFSLTPSTAPRQLNTGFGNFTYTAKITFKDGTSVTGSKSVAPYVPNGCWVGW